MPVTCLPRSQLRATALLHAGKTAGNGKVGETINRQRRRAAARQDTRRDNGRDQRQGEILRQKLGLGHAGGPFAKSARFSTHWKHAPVRTTDPLIALVRVCRCGCHRGHGRFLHCMNDQEVGGGRPFTTKTRFRDRDGRHASQAAKRPDPLAATNPVTARLSNVDPMRPATIGNHCDRNTAISAMRPTPAGTNRSPM
ncbi:hypothetical protein ABIB06_002063 [Bradyrhizobium sp. LB8.2]